LLHQVPDLSLPKLGELSQSVQFVLVNEVPDHAAANWRNIAYAASKMGPKVLFVPVGCGSHRIHRIISVTLKEDDLVGNIFAVQLVAQIPSHYARLVRVLRDLVEDELLVFPGHPDESWAQHSKAIVDHTFLRTQKFIRGRLDGGVSLFRPGGDKESEARSEKLCRILNYDARVNRIGHCCTGRDCCPGGRAESIEKVTAAIVESGLLLGCTNSRTSNNRWGSSLNTLSDECAGMLFHSILPRTMARAFIDYRAADPGVQEDNDDGEDYRKMIQRKVTRASNKSLNSRSYSDSSFALV
jgi:hypothetical protein